ncbi:MAG: cation:proton antiporter [gamma proteobacterium symbiont of Bathyaustriella thionipta]|nr:cation:proton antiporter [gamma proteobacterium symbiont of Bathyaustriella thionipta]
MTLVWIIFAYILGFAVRLVGLPPLVGFLIAGFVLNALDLGENSSQLHKIGDVGVTLLLFSIGLKLKLRTLARSEVWGVASIHMTATVLLFGLGIYGLALTGLPLFNQLDFGLSLLVAFALSFSSTVFAVKVLEDKGEMDSRHGRIAIGILIVQDLIAVVFLAFSAGKIPTPWAALLLLLIPARPLLMWIMNRSGHGEMLLLFGLVLAVGGAEAFDLVGVRGDLGALFLGVLVATHPKASELSHTLMGFKDLFLVAFFLSIGLTGEPSIPLFMAALGLAVLVSLKTGLFYWLLTRFRLRARTSTLATLSLTNYSEFGLIVGAVAVSNGWLPAEWLITIAIALSISFVLASPLNSAAHELYNRFHDPLSRWENARHLPDDEMIDPGDARIVVFGMGRVGQGVYQTLQEQHGACVVGIDSDSSVVETLQTEGWRVIQGDGTDSDFWAKVPQHSQVQLVLLTLPNFEANLDVAHQLSSSPYQGQVAATVKFEDEVEVLKQAGVDAVFNIYAEAGSGFADHVMHDLGAVALSSDPAKT